VVDAFGSVRIPLVNSLQLLASGQHVLQRTIVQGLGQVALLALFDGDHLGQGKSVRSSSSRAIVETRDRWTRDSSTQPSPTVASSPVRSRIDEIGSSSTCRIAKLDSR
jgi:hypothetical protein